MNALTIWLLISGGSAVFGGSVYMRRDAKRAPGALDDLAEMYAAIFVVGICLFMVLSVVALAGARNRWKCRESADAMGVPWSFGYGKGCMIRIDQRWIPFESFRVEP